MDGINKMETHKNLKDRKQLDKEFKYNNLHSKSGKGVQYE